MDRVAVFVDAGYLFAQGSVALAGEKLPRGRLVLNHEKVVRCLETFARQVSGLPLLRIYWYDGTSTGPTAQHNALAYLHDLKVRLGFVNSVGEQKGVDSLIVTDIIALARNGAMADAVLLSGDEDLRVGVQQAQELGVRVHLLGIRPSRGSQSVFLLQEADTTHEWGPQDLSDFLSCRPTPTSEEASRQEVIQAEDVIGLEPLDLVAAALAQEIPVSELNALTLTIRETGQIPMDLDGRLLAKGGGILNSRLGPSQKKRVREAFVTACEARLKKQSHG